ncbi:hypothetical protein NDU88_006507 [Pleurodeles waltl]|uniref:Uncharacterized protein n=1 Tax=Pleurodeles waltl TaxID=8319 RepID=A0AAV7TZP7_PLEWA|nr:hypothetical protein NDU88_006507 [Pleurodeles waltl]
MVTKTLGGRSGGCVAGSQNLPKSRHEYMMKNIRRQLEREKGNYTKEKIEDELESKGKFVRGEKRSGDSNKYINII